ncbi:MAG: glycoside hydrolase family 2 [Bacteroidales bacterium]|nr:glycoside hydrolase family 2 [Bacteroidales bacterium]
MKKALLFIAMICGFSVIRAQETEIQYLSGTDKDNMVQWDFMVNNGMNKDKWSKIGVPSNWELQGFGSYLYGKVNKEVNETGHYKYEFNVSENWKKKLVFIVFEGSMTDTEVKINGKPAGPIHQGAFYQFKYDITGLLNWGGNNLLEVKVTKESANESVNRAERLSDYWVFGGIFRPVYLKAVPTQFIDRVAIDAKADGSFYMDVYTKGKGKARIVTAQLQTIDGKPFGGKISSSINKDTTGKAILKGTFSKPALWNPEFPNLYQVVVTITSGDKVIHQLTQKFGFRTVEVRPEDGIYVNNQKIIFRGVCRHTFWPSSGRTSSKKLAIDDVSLMKDMNMNAVRMSHYPPDQYFLDVCDSMGMFVLDELAGWQKFYDTPTAKRLVRQVVERDVNHPSIVLWDNGNEGGFNKDVRGEYALYDPQKRTVIEPWSIINNTDTKHYPKFNYVQNVLNYGKNIYFPTEFLHGLNDGGHGAGLDDQWNFMMSKPLSAGAFLWVFADEGVERRDKNDSIDTWGNQAPDGILGPYHEKEGSFYTVKEIWSPVHIKTTKIGPDFDGKLEVINRFLYSNLNLGSYSYELVKYGNNFPKIETVRKSGPVKSPDIGVGEHGTLNLELPVDWKSYDVLYVTAVDQYGRNINTWSWNIVSPQDFSSRTVNSSSASTGIASVFNDQLSVSSGNTIVTFNKLTGSITSVSNNGKDIPFGGLEFAGLNRKFKEMKSYALGDDYIVDIQYDSASYAKWTFLKGGWLKLDYGYSLNGSHDFSGISFTYPENLVTGAKLMADGPYRVWKNRLKGTQFGVHEKKYNNSITGQSWEYPEFKGYYSNFYAVEIQTKELPITIISSTDDLFLHLFTPAVATNLKGVRGGVNPPFPSGNISLLHGISAVGTKFSRADEEGPQGRKNIYNGEQLTGTIYFRFGK